MPPAPEQPQYLPPQYSLQPIYMVPAQPTSTLAIVAFILSMTGFSLPAIICAHIALSQLKRNGQSGRGLAIAGLIIGYISLFLIFLLLTFYGFLIFNFVDMANNGLVNFYKE